MKALALAEEKRQWHQIEPSMRRALYWKDSKNWYDAHFEALRVTHHHPDHLPAWQLRAEIEFLLGRYETCIATCSPDACPCSAELSDWKTKCDVALELISDQEAKGVRWAKPDEWAMKHSGDLRKDCPILAALDAGEGSNQHVADFGRFLTEPFVTEVDKHRVIWTWIHKNVVYNFENNSTYRKTENPPFDTLKYCKGVCRNQTELYHDLANAAGLMGGGSMYSTQGLRAHIWNTIIIDGKRYPQDVTWSMWYQTCSDKIKLSRCHLGDEDWKYAGKGWETNTDVYEERFGHRLDNGLGVFDYDYSWPSGMTSYKTSLDPWFFAPDSTICCVSGIPQQRSKGFCRLCRSFVPSGCFRDDSDCIRKHYTETLYSAFQDLGFPLSGEPDPLLYPLKASER